MEQYQLFYLTNDIDELVRVRIISMDGDIDYSKIGLPEFPKTKPNQVRIGAFLLNYHELVAAGEETTSTRDYVSKAEWNDVLFFPVKYSELSQDATLIFRAYCYHPEREYVLVGEACLPLFNQSKTNSLRKGIKRLRIEANPHSSADLRAFVPRGSD